MNRRIISAALFAAAVGALLGACDRGQGGGAAQRPKRVPRVAVWKVEPRDVRYEIDAVGSIEADEVRVHARLSGVLAKVSFREGDSVTTEKSVLAEIDPERYALELARAKADAERAQASWAKAKADYENNVRLFEKRVIMQDEVSTSETLMQEAKAAWDLTKASLALAEKNARESSVRPPMDGIIQSKSAVLGEYVKPETLIATMMDLSTLRLKFALAESEAARIGVGQKVSFSLKSSAERYTADVFSISQSAHPRTRMVECRAKNIRTAAGESAVALRPGLYATVAIETDVNPNAIVVPSDAILPTEKGFTAYVLDGKTARARTVETGLRMADGGVEVRGLKAGDLLIVQGGNVLRDGVDVEVQGK